MPVNRTPEDDRFRKRFWLGAVAVYVVLIEIFLWRFYAK